MRISDSCSAGERTILEMSDQTVWHITQGRVKKFFGEIFSKFLTRFLDILKEFFDVLRDFRQNNMTHFQNRNNN